MEIKFKLDKKKLLIAAIVIFIVYSLSNGNSGNKGGAQKEVEKLITYKLEKDYSKKMLRSVYFSEMEVDL